MAHTLSKPAEVARSMVERYGYERAAEYAHGYAVGAYFKQTPYGRDHWMQVCTEIKALKKHNGGKTWHTH